MGETVSVMEVLRNLLAGGLQLLFSLEAAIVALVSTMIWSGRTARIVAAIGTGLLMLAIVTFGRYLIYAISGIGDDGPFPAGPMFFVFAAGFVLLHVGLGWAYAWGIQSISHAARGGGSEGR